MDIPITRFYFVRHAMVQKKSDHLPPHDPPITNQPHDLTSLIEALPKGADWHISPLQRTRQTADLLKAQLDPQSTKIEPALVEQSFGTWDEQLVADIWKELKDKPRHNWSYMTADRVPPGGESFAQQCLRVAHWCQLQEQQEFLSPQILITHAGTIRAMLAHMLDISPDRALSFDVPNLGYFEAHLMNAKHGQNHAGGLWQVKSLP
ncbi:histidine phosphatase family protein [Candidatus Puniceispirillum sp.]|uniref:histidine phosphatase family protein n=1 Tax=Candidatus Puniceispirillum sp. TaxID=2026719 RepID=UPI001EBD5251|nr:histidine phosphatase family protein [Candidatus Puniceispirillum sp.]